MHGKRDLAYYGDRDTYAMLDLDRHNVGKDEESGPPTSLLAGGKPRDSDEFKDYRKPVEYSNIYGETVDEIRLAKQ